MTSFFDTVHVVGGRNVPSNIDQYHNVCTMVRPPVSSKRTCCCRVPLRARLHAPRARVRQPLGGPSPNRARASNVCFFQRVAWYLADSQIWPLRKSRSSSGGRRRDISMCHRLAWRLPAFRHTSSRPSREILPVQTQDMSAMTASAATTRVADLGARRTNAVRGAGRRVVASASRRVASVTSAEYKARPGRRRAISRSPRVL